MSDPNLPYRALNLSPYVSCPHSLHASHTDLTSPYERAKELLKSWTLSLLFLVMNAFPGSGSFHLYIGSNITPSEAFPILNVPCLSLGCYNKLPQTFNLFLIILETKILRSTCGKIPCLVRTLFLVS